MNYTRRLTPETTVIQEELNFECNIISVNNLSPYSVYINYSGDEPSTDNYDFEVLSGISTTIPVPPGKLFSLFLHVDVVVENVLPAFVNFFGGPVGMRYAQLFDPLGSVSVSMLARITAADYEYDALVVTGTGPALVWTYTCASDTFAVFRNIFLRLGSTANALTYLEVQKNTVTPPLMYLRGDAWAAYTTDLVIPWEIPLAAGDTIELYLYNFSGVSVQMTASFIIDEIPLL